MYLLQYSRQYPCYILLLLVEVLSASFVSELLLFIIFLNVVTDILFWLLVLFLYVFHINHSSRFLIVFIIKLLCSAELSHCMVRHDWGAFIAIMR